MAELEKKCKLLEETIKSKNPNSIGMLIQAAKAEPNEDLQNNSKRELQAKVDTSVVLLNNKSKDKLLPKYPLIFKYPFVKIVFCGTDKYLVIF